MKNKSRKTGHFIGEVLIGLLFLFAVVGVFLWSVNRIVSSIEYKKSADVRTVTARVIDYDIRGTATSHINIVSVIIPNLVSPPPLKQPHIRQVLMLSPIRRQVVIMIKTPR